MKRTRVLNSLLILCAAAFISMPAGATALTVGGSVSVIDPFTAIPGTLLASLTSPFTSNLGAGDFSGSVTEAVYRDTVTNNMDFVYQFHSNVGSAQSIEAMVDSSFLGFTTDVFVDTAGAFGSFTTGGVTPISANRATGASINWTYLLAGSQTSAILMIKTNAPAFTAGNISFQNSGIAAVSGFQPTVPEPTTLSLMGLGLLGLGLIRRRQVKK